MISYHFFIFSGFFNCLSNDGTVYDTTKYGWLQGRQVWTYCQLYTSLDRFKKQEILDAAVKGNLKLIFLCRTNQGSIASIQMTKK